MAPADVNDGGLISLPQILASPFWVSVQVSMPTSAPIWAYARVNWLHVRADSKSDGSLTFMPLAWRLATALDVLSRLSLRSKSQLTLAASLRIFCSSLGEPSHHFLLTDTIHGLKTWLLFARHFCASQNLLDNMVLSKLPWLFTLLVSRALNSAKNAMATEFAPRVLKLVKNTLFCITRSLIPLSPSISTVGRLLHLAARAQSGGPDGAQLHFSARSLFNRLGKRLDCAVHLRWTCGWWTDYRQQRTRLVAGLTRRRAPGLVESRAIVNSPGGADIQARHGAAPARGHHVFCNDDLAYRALLTALRLKIDLPQRMAVAGFNHLTGSDPVLLAPMRVKTVARPQVDLSWELVARDSS